MPRADPEKLAGREVAVLVLCSVCLCSVAASLPHFPFLAPVPASAPKASVLNAAHRTSRVELGESAELFGEVSVTGAVLAAVIQCIYAAHCRCVFLAVA